MTSQMADIIGLIGSAMFVGGFAYANMAKDMNKILFNALNLVGALLLLASLWVNFNLAAFVLEIVWAFIALGGLIFALKKKREAAQ